MANDNRLQELRIKNNLTQEELAKILNVSRNQIYRYESGENDLSLQMVKKICEYFNVSLDYFACNDKASCNYIKSSNDKNVELEELKFIRKYLEEELNVINSKIKELNE